LYPCPLGYRCAYGIALRIWVGIDVCQKYLDVYIRPSGKLFQVTNDEVGIGKLVQTLENSQPELIVLEATGGMEIDASIKLTQAGLAVAVINPRQARDFALINRTVSARPMRLMLGC
jgi:transposase